MRRSAIKAWRKCTLSPNWAASDALLDNKNAKQQFNRFKACSIVDETASHYHDISIANLNLYILIVYVYAFKLPTSGIYAALYDSHSTWDFSVVV
jgi:hypothetical protein